MITMCLRSNRRRGPGVALLILGSALVPWWAAAQVAAPPGVTRAAERPSPAAAAAAVEPAPAQPFTYEPSGRRDPFLNLIGGVETQVAIARHIDGVAGLSVNETTVRGVMKSGGALIALVQGADKKTYVVHPGDKLLDGTIKTVVPEGLVILQPVNDPRALVKQRAVRKLLRSVEDGKQ
jgi:Tfp pilus assembly protein PilP